MPKKKLYRLSIDFGSKEDMENWAKSLEKRPYVVAPSCALDNISGVYTVKRHKIVDFLDKDWPEEKDLHPIAQGIRFSRLG
tara:strand:+ start:180 stop:422 length:243 start_codon:yes stop_codon:yes gene_type:complete